MPSTLGIVASGQNFPLSLSPALWLDAADTTTITESGGSVSQWNDKSGNGRHVTQSSGTAQPTSGVTTQNGFNVLDFDGDDFLSRSAAGLPTTGARTIFAVVRYTGASTLFYQHIAMYGNATSTINRSWGIAYSRVDSDYRARVHIWSNVSQSPISAQPLLTNTWHQVGATYDGASSTTVFADGVDGASNSLTLDTLVNGELRIGSRTFTPAEYWEGQIAEIVFFDFELDAGQRTSVETYLAGKWGL